MSTKLTGDAGEKRAMEYLIHQGYQVLACNYRFGPYEIDLIVQDAHGMIIFIEVKSSTGSYRSHPELRASDSQMKRVAIAAGEYLHEREYEGEIRFDVIGVHMTEGEEAEIHHYRDVYFPQH